MLPKRATIAALGVMSAISLGGPAAYAGEPVQLKGSTSLELPKPAAEFNDGRKLNYGNKGSQELQGGFVAPPSIQGSKVLDKKARELMDKNRNWIFVNPYETHYDAKTENFLKGEKGTGLFDQRWMNDSEQKTQVEKFMEEKDQARGSDARDNNSRDSDSSDSGKGGPKLDKAGNDPLGLRIGNDKPDEDGTAAKNIFDTPGLPFGKAAGLDDLFPAAGDSKASRMSNPFMPERSQSSAFDKDALKKSQEQHDLEFGKFLSEPRGASFSLPGGGADVLNNSFDATRMATEPTAPRRVDQILNYGRGDAPVFSSGIPSGLSSGLSSGRASIDVSGKDFARTSTFLAPAPSVPSVQAPSFSPSPFQLPFPQRKF